MEVTHCITGKTSPSLEKIALWAHIFSTLAILSLFALLVLQQRGKVFGTWFPEVMSMSVCEHLLYPI